MSSPSVGHEGGDGGEVRRAVAGEGDEGDVLAAGAFDVAAADDALAVGEQHDLEQHGRRVGGGAGVVVVVAGVEAGQVELVIDQVVQRVFEGAGEQLPLQIDGNKARAGVDVFVARHAGLQMNFRLSLDIPFGSRQNARMKRLFLQPR